MKKHKLFSLSAGERVEIQTLTKGEFIVKVTAKGANKKVYQLEGYCRYNQAYELSAVEDCLCDFAYLKKGKIVEIADY